MLFHLFYNAVMPRPIEKVAYYTFSMLAALKDLLRSYYAGIKFASLQFTCLPILIHVHAAQHVVTPTITQFFNFHEEDFCDHKSQIAKSMKILCVEI